MKIALITDTHFGARNDSLIFTDFFRKFYENIFFPTLKERGLLFVGLDVIGDYLTEINVTSPTCVREIDRAQNLDIADDLMDCIQEKLEAA